MRCNVDRNKKDRSFDQQYKSIEQLIREAYGLSPDQMEKRMEWAEGSRFRCASGRTQYPECSRTRISDNSF